LKKDVIIMKKIKNIEWRKMMKKLFLSIILLFSFTFPAFAQTTSPSFVLKVNNVQVDAKEGAPFVSNGTTYVPVNTIVQKMGDKVTWVKSQMKSIIQKKNKTVISIKANQTIAVFNGKVVPLVTKKVNGKTVNANIKALYKNNVLYVPVQFVSASQGLGYPLKIAKEGSKTVIYVGKIPASSKPSKPNTNTQQPSGKKYPDGWVAPVLKSSWTPDREKNRQIIEKELGFEEGTAYHIPGQVYAITIDYYRSKSEVMISYSVWQSKSLPASYRIPIVSKELFKFYFGKDADRVWNYFNKNDIPEKFTANGRTVKVHWNEADARLYVEIGYPNKPF
jgi:hypothetical protein